MGYKTPDNPPDSEFPQDDNSEEPSRSNGHESETPPQADESDESDESPETSEASDSEQGDEDEIPPLPDLGEASSFDLNEFPTASQMRRAAKFRLDWETAFMLLHQDDPDKIAERIDEMADMIRAAISVQGQPGSPERQPDLKQAVRLGLALELRYWQRANRFEAWLDLIGMLLTTAIQMEEFQSDVFLAWSIYHYMEGNLSRARKAIEGSQEFAAESGRPDLALLAKAHQFNFDALTLAVDEAERLARDLINEARRLRYDYVRGRIYFSLARAYAERVQDSKKIFEYAQQAVAILICGERFELANESLMFMLGSMGIKNDHSAAYRDALRAYFERITEKCVSPVFQASAYFFQGRDQHYYQGQYDEAMLPLLNARRKYRQAVMPENVARTLHMLGMVQTKRRKWPAAEYYLTEAITRYEQMGHKGYEVLARHAHAFIPYEYEDWALTHSRLLEVLAIAEANRDAVAQEVIDEIKRDIEHVKEKLQS